MPRVGRSTETKSSTGRWGWELVLRVDRVSSARRRRMGLHSSVSALNTTDLHTYLHLRLYIYVTYILPHTAEGIILRTPHQPVSTTMVRGPHSSLESYKDGITTDPFWRLRKQAQSGHGKQGWTHGRAVLPIPTSRIGCPQMSAFATPASPLKDPHSKPVPSHACVPAAREAGKTSVWPSHALLPPLRPPEVTVSPEHTLVTQN